MNNDANFLIANNGHIDLTKHWAKYLLSRMGFVKRMANTKAKVTVEHFDELKKLFLLEFNNVVEMDEVSAELIINWDQMGINYIPVSSRTMEEESSKRVQVVGKNDKRHLTALYACSMSGDFLPVQLVYQEKLSDVYQNINFLQIGTSPLLPITGAMNLQCVTTLTK